jgi:hypothetical protein
MKMDKMGALSRLAAGVGARLIRQLHHTSLFALE